MTGEQKHNPGKGGADDPERGASARQAEGSVSLPARSKPWEDTSLSPLVRLEAYRDFVITQIEAMRAAVVALGSDSAAVLEIQNAHETRLLLSEAKGLEHVTAEEFCRRIDYRKTPLEIAQDMVASYSFTKNMGVSTFIVPAGVTDVEAMKALNEYVWWNHPGIKRDAVDAQHLDWFEKLPEEFPAQCQQRDYSHARQITITGIVKGTVHSVRARQELVLKRASLVFSDPRDQAIAAALHACTHNWVDLFESTWVRGSVPGVALYTHVTGGVRVDRRVGDGGYGDTAASGSPPSE